MSAPILFIHNRAMSYRQPCFRLVQDYFGNRMAFWFFNETERSFQPARYFPFLRFRIRFSISVIIALLKNTSAHTVILAGSHSYELPFLFIACRLRKKKVAYWTETWDWGHMDLKNRFFFSLHRWIARHAAVVIYPGTRVHALYTKLNIPENRQFFAPNASVPPQPSRTPVRFYPVDHRIHVLFFGRFLKLKGLSILLRAMQELPQDDYHLFIAGDGDAAAIERYRQEASVLAHSTFIGPIAPFQVHALLSNADVYVYPTTAKYGIAEAWGLTVNEAVAVSTPVVATTAVAAAYDLITQNKNGYMVSDNDPHALAEAIKKSAHLPRGQVLKTSREKSILYSYEQMANGFILAAEHILPHPILL